MREPLRGRAEFLKHRFPWIVVAGIMLAGISLRFHWIHEPVRVDEGFTMLHYAPNPLRLIALDASYANNHFLHSMAVHFTYSWFGFSDWGMRAPAFAAGIAVLLLMAMLAWEITRDVWAVLFATLLGATSTPLIYYSVNGRGYSMQMMFTLALAWVLWRSRVWRSEVLGLITVSGLIIAILYTVPSGVIVVLPLALAFFALVMFRRSAGLALQTGAVSLIAGLGLLVAFAPILRTLIGFGSGQRPSWRPVLLQAAGMACDGVLPWVMAGITVIAGLWVVTQKRPEAGWVLGATLFGYPALLMILGSWLPFPVMFERSYSLVFPLVYVLMACGICAAVRGRVKMVSQWVLSLAVAIVIASYGTHACWAISKDPSQLYCPERPIMAAGRTLVTSIAPLLKRGDVVAGTNSFYELASAFYVIRARGFHGFYSLLEPEGRHLQTVYLLAGSSQEADQIWKNLSSRSRWSRPQVVNTSEPLSLYRLKRMST